MAGMSSYTAQGLFDRTLNPSTRTAPNFLALHTAPVNDASYGSETNYIGYTRQVLDSMYSEFVEEALGEIALFAKNGAQVEFGISSGPLATITHWAIWDNAGVGSGNVLYSGPLEFGKIIEAGDRMIVAPDAITVRMR